jgi:hypothetical protein
MSILNKLTEGIVNRDLSREGAAILTKWEKTGLLEGLDDYDQNTMAVLLENQAKELLRESNSMAGGDVEGFAAVAFPIVRRVFGGLLAQKLVSVQPMSLPSGLIFFMDFVKEGVNSATTGSAYAATSERDGETVSASGTGGDQPSVYGGDIVGRQLLTTGVDLDPDDQAANVTPQFYDLQHGMSAARGMATVPVANVSCVAVIPLDGALTDGEARLLDFDADLLARRAQAAGVFRITRANFDAAFATDNGLTAGATNHPLGATGLLNGPRMVGPDIRHLDVQDEDGTALVGGDLAVGGTSPSGATRLVRRLSKLIVGTDGPATDNAEILSLNAAGTTYVQFVLLDTASVTMNGMAEGALNGGLLSYEFALSDNIDESTDAGNTDTLGALVGATAWEMEGSVDIPEISIRVDSVAVTAMTRKLKASWTPELAQDLNAYHNLDAEVELTGILSEQIALEIDQEILADLVSGAGAGTLFWSRRPGLFVNRQTGADATSLAAPPDFTGSVSEWYETLVETINDVSADIHRKTLRGGANFLVCGPEIANILEFTSGFRASVTHDDDTGSVGAINAGSISKKWDLWVDPYFPRNVILVGRKGSSFLESGYVYAPYVPLQTTPTIFHADDFTPRKAVMTRYGKKLVRPDMYGLVIVRDLEG